MKIKFNPNLDFQHEAINSIKSVFKGQEICQTNFTVIHLNIRLVSRKIIWGLEIASGCWMKIS